MANTLDSATTARIRYGTDVLSYFKMSLALGKTVSRKYTQVGMPLSGIVRVPKLTTPGVTKRTKNSNVTWGDSASNYVDVTLDTHAIVPMQLDTLDSIISDVDFRQQMAMQAGNKLAEQIETDLGALYYAVPNFAGTVTTHAFAADTTARTANRNLDVEKAPSVPRYGAITPAAKDSALGLAQWTQYNTAGADSTLVSGDLGVRYGIAWMMTHGLPLHVGGGVTQWGGTVLVAPAGALIGATAIPLDGFTIATPALKKGDSVKIKNFFYSLTANVTGAGNIATIQVSPPVRETLVDNDVVTAGEGVKSGAIQLVYLPEAFALATAPIADSGERSGTQTSQIVDADTGLSITVTSSWDHTYFRHLFSTEILYGVQCVRPEAATRMLADE
jgi:hypothetical protein